MKPKETLFSSRVLLFFGIVIFIIIYYKTPFIFFQQDEIFGFGLFIRNGWRVVLSGLGSNTVVHFVPLTMSISYLIYKVFGMNYWIYNLVGMSFHLVNGILVYQIAKRIFKEKASAIITALVFISSNVASELIMWPVISINSIALIFSLIAWLVVIDENFLRYFRGYIRGILISLLFLLALFSVEYSAGLILFIPIVILLKEEISVKAKMKLIIPFVITGFSYLILRFISVLSNQGLVNGVNRGTLFPARVFNLVMQYSGQLFLGQSLLLSFSKFFTKIFYPLNTSDAFVENNVYLVVAIIAGLVLVIVSYLMYLKMKRINNLLSKHFLSIFLLILFSSLPFLLIPGQAGNFSIFSSRYMYFGLAGMAFYYGFIYYFAKRAKTTIVYVVSSLLIFLVVASGAISNFRKSEQLYVIGKTRINILQTISKSVLELPPKVVFYTESNAPYYGLPDSEKVMPFQSGFGQTLLIFLTQKNQLPKDFYPGDYLWDITSQGYEKFDGRGFGYFRDFNLLKETVKKYNIPEKSVFAFSWSSKNNSLENISDKIRQDLK
jgi:hypothetical protein